MIKYIISKLLIKDNGENIEVSDDAFTIGEVTYTISGNQIISAGVQVATIDSNNQFYLDSMYKQILRRIKR